MTTTVNLDNDAIARAGLVDPEHHGIHKIDDEQHQQDFAAEKRQNDFDADQRSVTTDDNNWPNKPTPEQMRTLRRVSGKIKWAMWTIAFVELCERFSYYGSAVLYTNFVNHKLPNGSTTGAPLAGDPHPQAGALGMGPKAAQGLSLFNQFFAYIMPLLGYVFCTGTSLADFC